MVDTDYQGALNGSAIPQPAAPEEEVEEEVEEELATNAEDAESVDSGDSEAETTSETK